MFTQRNKVITTSTGVNVYHIIKNGVTVVSDTKPDTALDLVMKFLFGRKSLL